MLLGEEHLTALLCRLSVTQRALAGVVADAKRVSAEFQIAEQVAAGGVAAAAAGLANAAVDFANNVGVRHAGVLEDHLAVLVETPATIIEDLADAETRRVARH